MRTFKSAQKSAFANKSAQKSTLKSTFGSSEPIWQEVENPDKIPEVLHRKLFCSSCLVTRVIGMPWLEALAGRSRLSMQSLRRFFLAYNSEQRPFAAYYNCWQRHSSGIPVVHVLSSYHARSPLSPSAR